MPEDLGSGLDVPPLQPAPPQVRGKRGFHSGGKWSLWGEQGPALERAASQLLCLPTGQGLEDEGGRAWSTSSWPPSWQGAKGAGQAGAARLVGVGGWPPVLGLSFSSSLGGSV